MNNHPNSSGKGIGKGMIVMAMLLFLGLMTFVFQSEIDNQTNPNQKVVSRTNNSGQTEIVLKRNRSGHYITSGTINYKSVVFLLDTGATNVAVPQQIANYLKLEPGRKIAISTANGNSIGYQTMINHLSIGDIELRNIRAIITPNLNDILLGMSALKQLEFSQKGNQLVLRQ